MKRYLMLLLVPALAAGCAESMRGWQRQAMPSHDRQRVFQAAQDVLDEHFDIAEASIVRGTIETKPQVFNRRREGTLADVRGAGGQWRRTVFFGAERSGLTMVCKVAVLLEREATEAAVASADQHRNAPETEVPVAPESDRSLAGRPKKAVWMETGYEDALARELLSAILERVRQLEGDMAMPMGQSPREAAEEVRRLGTDQGF